MGFWANKITEKVYSPGGTIIDPAMAKAWLMNINDGMLTNLFWNGQSVSLIIIHKPALHRSSHPPANQVSLLENVTVRYWIFVSQAFSIVGRDAGRRNACDRTRIARSYFIHLEQPVDSSTYLQELLKLALMRRSARLNAEKRTGTKLFFTFG